jgi:hypothetical protein
VKGVLGGSVSGRKLAGIEHALRLTDYATPFNAVVVLRIEGDFPADRLPLALDQLQSRHPLLRACIRGENDAFSFYFDNAGPIPVEIDEPRTTDDWLAAAEEELHRRFELAAGPLMRCRYRPVPSGGHLIVTIHHIIADGVSAKHLVHELLSLCAGLTADSAETPQEGRFQTRAFYPARYSGAGMIAGALAFLARQMADEAKFRWNARGVRRAPIAEKGRCRVLPIRYPRKLTSALLEASRRERITLNNMLGAAMLAAVGRHLYPSPRAPLRHIVLSDLRPHLRPALSPSELGCRISMLRFTVVVQREGSFWELARDVQESTLRAVRSGGRYISDSMSPRMMQMIMDRKAFRMGTTALSYPGPIDLPSSYGPFAVTGLDAFTNNFPLGPEYSALAHLFRGELSCDILYMDSDMDLVKAQQIALDMQSILEAHASPAR